MSKRCFQNHLRLKAIVFLLLLNSIVSCKKDWLDAKPDISLTVPTTIADYQALLDNSDNVFNINYPLLGEIGSDDYYILMTNWEALFTATEKNAYIWSKDVYAGETGQDWNNCYTIVYNANIVLDGIQELSPVNNEEQVDWNNVQGSALFFRSFAFYQLLQLFAKPYDADSAANDLGVPLRLNSNVNVPSSRASIKEGYDQIIGDLKAASLLLPDLGLQKSRPSKTAALALLARTYLTMGAYDSARKYANEALNLYSTLINYNTLDSTLEYPITIFNDEDIFHAWGISYYIFFPSNLIIDSSLYAAYDQNDLRGSEYFTQNSGFNTFRGSYTGSFVFYTGIATDEIFLIRAECNVRLGELTSSLQDLNTLLSMRYKIGSFEPIQSSDSFEILKTILLERRKELLFRGLRWTDLRRLNSDIRFSKTLRRKLNLQEYSLPPEDNRYVLPIPEQEIQVSGIQQNPR